MKSFSWQLKEKLYRNVEHPYRIYERTIRAYLPTRAVLLDTGCGRDMPILRKVCDSCSSVTGVDLVKPEIAKLSHIRKINFIHGDIQALAVRSGSIDMVICRSVIEHLRRPGLFFGEINRVLKKGGYFVFLAPNLYDYASIAAKLIPNRLHKSVVRYMEGRNEDDTFPTYYRANTVQVVTRLAGHANLETVSLIYLGQYPSYFLFNPILFLLGAAYDRLVCRSERVNENETHVSFI